MTKTPIPFAIDLDDMQHELALAGRAGMREVLDDLLERYPEHELELLRFVVDWLLDETGNLD